MLGYKFGYSNREWLTLSIRTLGLGLCSQHIILKDFKTAASQILEGFFTHVVLHDSHISIPAGGEERERKGI